MADFIDDAIAVAGVTMEVTPMDGNVFKCDFKSRYHQMTRTITMAEGYGAPVLGNLVYYYLTEIQLYNDCDDILEWADDLGLDPGDGATLKRYRQLDKDLSDLRLLFDENNYQKMMMALEISQAIANADPK